MEPVPVPSSTDQPTPTEPVPTSTIPTPTASPTVVPTGMPTMPPTTPGNSSIPYGQVLSNCTVPGTIAISFDDGPFDYTNELLDILEKNGAKGTFFVNAMNFGSIQDYAAVMLRAFNGGHQLGSHTYSHADLSMLNRTGIITEMTKLENVLSPLINGYKPTYMRAPYFAYSDVVLKTMAELQYHMLDANVDTKDYENATPQGVPISFKNFQTGLDAGGSIVLCHDVHQTTVQILMQQLLDEVKKRGLKAVTIGECLGDPQENWYRK
ncbi:uncharacterized protein GIQ15_02124 [Arthroderma uncinatum]|uniref:uncharacterized protein n=1 Tax=Arthroderma uncinatum TaxID=74035 RepID=UPI00144A6EF1|nr:uncharacterized protein GIQ15_02124 [Arthroderma uncinatum]KAF3482800.1 hypothetical protein GIQ15_02124 [Arthroderma uncinatum]